jgi:hypothetical protein
MSLIAYPVGAYLIGAAWFAAGSVPIFAVIGLRKRIGALNAASWLVAYGLLVLLLEHVGFTFTYTLAGLPEEGFVAPPHARIHAFMAAVYAVIGMTGFAVLMVTMLRKRSRLAWVMLLTALIIGGSIDVITNGPAGLLYKHTSPPNPIPGANVLWTYLFAWAAALLVSWSTVFARGSVPTGPDTGSSLTRAGSSTR